MGAYEVRMANPCSVDRVFSVWPQTNILKPVGFATLHTIADGTFVDIIGRLSKMTPPAHIGPNKMVKTVFTLSDGTYEQEVALLSRHALFEADLGSIIAIKGAAVKRYGSRFDIQTCFLSHICADPPDINDDFRTLDITQQQPCRKVLRLATPDSMSLTAVRNPRFRSRAA